MKIATTVIVCLVCLSTRLEPQKASSQTASARRSFQELIDANDASIVGSLAASHAYVCFEDGKDEFLLVSFQAPLDAWHPLAASENGEASEGSASLQQYVKGADDPQGVTLSVNGQWQRTASSLNDMSFSGTSRKTRPTSPYNGSITIDNGQFNVIENYLNADDGQVEYRLTLRRSTGRFTESYRIASKNEKLKLLEDSGYCSIYKDGQALDPEPPRPVAHPSKR